MYISENSVKSQHDFIQKRPSAKCRNVSNLKKTQEYLGLEHLPRCRNPRCSRECRNKWAYKHANCVARHLQSLSNDFTIYRGCLKLAIDASPEEHKKVKRRFLRLINSMRKRHGYFVGIHAIAHPTDKLNCHYDFACYSDAPRSVLRQAIYDSWKYAGGKSSTCVPMVGDEIIKTLFYQCKFVSSNNKDNITTKSKQSFLLKRRKESGIDSTFSTAGFWLNTTEKQIWKSLISEWFPTPQACHQECMDAYESKNKESLKKATDWHAPQRANLVSASAETTHDGNDTTHPVPPSARTPLASGIRSRERFTHGSRTVLPSADTRLASKPP